MEPRKSRRFALLFTTSLIALTLVFVLVAERSLRSRGEWSLDVEVETTADGWTLRLEPSTGIYLYAVTEDEAGGLRLLFPLEGDGEILPLGADETFIHPLPGDTGSTLLLLADSRPLWSLEEARYVAGLAPSAGPGPVPLEPEDLLSVRGLAPSPEGGAADSISRTLPPLRNGTDHARGLWARRVPRS